MKVYKFGGASIKDAKSIKNVAYILKNEGTNNCVLVISAMGKMTNAFENIVNAYFDEPQKLTEFINFVTNYHTNIIDNLFTKEHQIHEKITILIGQMIRFLAENKSKDYDYVYDQIVCYGELISTKIVSNYLELLNIQNNWEDVRRLIKTDSTFRDATVDWEVTNLELNKAINKSQLTILQGFIGGNSEGSTTTLGREGSDYTAGILAYCLNATSVTIWKDVEGVLNADPRVFQKTQLLNQISYEETIEMAFYGASVIHPKTIQPLQSKEIPLFVRSFKDSKLSGTKVTRGVAIKPLIPCFIVKKNQILISISTLDFSFIMEDTISHIFNLLHQYQLRVNLIQNSAISFSVCIDNKFNKFDVFYNELKKQFKMDVQKEVDLYTVRHFDDKAIAVIEAKGKSLLTQINKETFQIVLEPN